MSYVNYMNIFMNHLKSNYFFHNIKDEFETSKIQKLTTFYSSIFFEVFHFIVNFFCLIIFI